MSLNIILKEPTATYKVEPLYESDITHNLGDMANKAGIYEALWKPYKLHNSYNNMLEYSKELDFEKSIIIKAKDIINIIEKGLLDLKAKPDYYKQFDSNNGWGIYKDFIPFIEDYLNALKTYPEAIVQIYR